MAGMALERLDSVLQKYPEYSGISTIVETGTADGYSTRKFVERFDEVHTIELSKELFELASEKLKDLPIHFHFGDSTKVLKQLSDEIKVPTLFYLDAHYCQGYEGRAATENPMPLFDELKTIAGRKTADIVIVDDVHAFGRKESDWEDVCGPAVLSSLAGKPIKDFERVHDWFVIYLSPGMDHVWVQS